MSALAELIADPASPPLIDQEGALAPEAPRDLASTGVDPVFLAELALKLTHTVPQCTTRWVCEEICLPLPMTEDLLQQLARDHLVEVQGIEGPFNHRYAITKKGHERAARVMGTSGYMGPAPVALDAYETMLDFFHGKFPEINFEEVKEALASLTLLPEDTLTAALAVMSQRSLFIYGPAGNGKTTVARLLHNVIQGELWIPYAIGVGQEVIRVFDPQLHEEAPGEFAQPWKVDRRWVRVRRPLVIAGGEMTLDSLEPSFVPSRGCYEAPMHIKANGGTFMIDDLGRQRIEPKHLLNRWIIPMEHGFDYFDLRTGQKIKMPFRQMLIVATNLELDQVTDPAFLRRMGYRLQLEAPTPMRYRQIFEKLASQWWTEVPQGLLDRLIKRYQEENRELRSCEPRDLLGRVQDICQLRKQPMTLDEEVLDLAWASYFGTKRK